MHAGNYDPMAVNTFCLSTGPDPFHGPFLVVVGSSVGQTASLLREGNERGLVRPKRTSSIVQIPRVCAFKFETTGVGFLVVVL